MPYHPKALLERHAEDTPRHLRGQRPSKCPCLTKLPREMCPQLIVSKALSRGTIRKSACLLAEVAYRKSQAPACTCSSCVGLWSMSKAAEVSPLSSHTTQGARAYEALHTATGTSAWHMAASVQ